MRDLDVRTALRRELERQHHGDDRTMIVEEMGVWSGTVRVDVAVINGELCGYEIKSARDNLLRLPSQENLYSQVFDRVTLVVAEQHAAKSRGLVPDWWGSIVAVPESDGTVALKLGRPAALNPSVNALQLTRLLWRSEALTILHQHGLSKGYRSAPAEKVFRYLAGELPLELLRDEVRETLKSRPHWSRKRGGDESKVTIGANLDPLRPSAGAGGGIGCNGGDALIAPAIWQPVEIRTCE